MRQPYTGKAGLLSPVTVCKERWGQKSVHREPGPGRGASKSETQCGYCARDRYESYLPSPPGAPWSGKADEHSRVSVMGLGWTNGAGRLGPVRFCLLVLVFLVTRDSCEQ